VAPEPSESFDYASIAVVAITLSIACFFSVLGLLHSWNKKCAEKCGCCVNFSEGVHILAPILYGLQVSDLISDWIFSLKIFQVSGIPVYLPILSILFVAVPYHLNLAILVSPHMNVEAPMKHNTYAQTWLKRNKMIFLCLVVLCGGTQRSILLCSSRLFGWDIFNSGLSKMEVNQYFGHRILLTTLLENIPQTIIQVLYALDTTTDFSSDITALISITMTGFSMGLSIISWVMYMAQKKSGAIFQISLNARISKPNALEIHKKTFCEELQNERYKRVHLEKSMRSLFMVKHNELQLSFAESSTDLETTENILSINFVFAPAGNDEDGNTYKKESLKEKLDEKKNVKVMMKAVETNFNLGRIGRRILDITTEVKRIKLYNFRKKSEKNEEIGKKLVPKGESKKRAFTVEGVSRSTMDCDSPQKTPQEQTTLPSNWADMFSKKDLVGLEEVNEEKESGAPRTTFLDDGFGNVNALDAGVAEEETTIDIGTESESESSGSKHI